MIKYMVRLLNPFIGNMENATVLKQTGITKVKGMTKLNRSLFDYNKQLLGVKVQNGITVGLLLRKLKKYLYKAPKFQSVCNLSTNEKLILLDPDLVNEDNYAQLGIHKQDLIDHNVKITYDNMTFDDVFKLVLSDNDNSVSGYSLIGHIVHLNLKECHMPYKYVIGEVLLDKVPSARCVVNKTSTIDSTFRNFQFEVLAGITDTVTTVKENGCRYQMDFEHVYWNPRLGTEHDRLVSLLTRDSVVYDVFAGIGPFAIPAARKYRVTVFANDLNPHSYHWLQQNIKLNKASEYVHIYNMDGHKFITDVVINDIVDKCKQEMEANFHVIMNLPGSAIEFLKDFRGLSDKIAEVGNDIYIHCYSFTKCLDTPESDIFGRIVAALPSMEVYAAQTNGINYHKVRRVAPNKDMYCVTFKLPRNSVFNDEHPSVCKKMKSL